MLSKLKSLSSLGPAGSWPNLGDLSITNPMQFSMQFVEQWQKVWSDPDYLNAMATARKRGGLMSVAGLREIAPYQYYVSGFQTGYNSEADGVYDIFESFGHDAPDRVLSEIEIWCASHPDQTFPIALLALAQSLRDKLIGL
jgi:hypothetical protein